MATTVPDNPFDTQQPAGTPGNGIVTGAMGASANQPAAITQAAAAASPVGDAAQFAASQRQLDRQTETTSGQLESLLAKDSPLMQRARALALQNMNQRGLVNSSMAQGAGVAAIIDRMTPIAQQDAQAYGNQALTNQKYVNEGGMFNVGEQNKFGLQRKEQAFAAAQAEAQRQFQAAQAAMDREHQFSVQKAQQEFTGAQNNLDRAQQRFLQEQSIEAQKDLQQAQQRFQAAENNLDRSLQTQLQAQQQQFTRAENVAGRTFEAEQRGLDRAQQASLAQAAQAFQATQNEMDRAQQIMLTDKTITANQALEKARQEFQRGENALDRTQQQALETARQTFQATQNEMDRAQQIMLTDRSITANQALERARQEFQRGENALDRTQQQSLETARQTFQATQAGLDRTHQESMTRLADTLSRANVSQTFAANITANTSSAINAIMADGNLSPEAKNQAIDNIIANANSTLQWGASFYNTPLPGMARNGPGTPINPAPAPAPPPPARIDARPGDPGYVGPPAPGGIIGGNIGGNIGDIGYTDGPRAQVQDPWGRSPGDPMYGVDPNYDPNQGQTGGGQ